MIKDKKIKQIIWLNCIKKNFTLKIVLVVHLSFILHATNIIIMFLAIQPFTYVV
jgi:hypothetical protein